MSNIERLSEAKVIELRAEHGWAKETIRAIESAVHAKLSAPVEVGEAEVRHIAHALRNLRDIDFDGVYERAASLVEQQAREIARLNDLAERLKQEAQIHAQEARTANSTIAEIYQCVSGGTGEPGNWNGAKPVRDLLDELRARLSRQGEVIKRAAEALAGVQIIANSGGLPEHAGSPWLNRCAASLAELRSVEVV